MTRVYNPDHGVSVVTFKNHKTIVTDSIQQKPIARNRSGYFPFIQMNANDVTYSTRLWRVIGKTELNAPLFERNRLINTLIELIESAQIKGYSSKSDQFEIQLEAKDVSLYKGKTLIGYKIKEDWFFDASRNAGEVRVIGICPIVEVQGKEVEAFWVYYPDVRIYLAQLKLDDPFFFHQFNSTIVRETNVQGKYIAEYTKPEDIAAEIVRIESHTIETEISLWIEYAIGG